MSKQIQVGKLRIILHEEYSDIYQGLVYDNMNWMNFHVINVYMEWASYKQSCELAIGLLGLNVIIEWNHE